MKNLNIEWRLWYILIGIGAFIAFMVFYVGSH